MARLTPREYNALYDNAVQADGSYQSQIDLQMSRSTSALAARCAGNIVCHAYDQSETLGPWMTQISAVHTWTEYLNPFGALYIAEAASILPFRITEGYTDICAVVRIATSERVELSTRLVVRQMPDEVMTTLYSSPSTPEVPREPLSWGCWRVRGSGSMSYWASTCYFRIADVHSGLPSGNRLLVGLQSMVTQPVYPLISGGGSLSTYVESIIIADSMPVTE